MRHRRFNLSFRFLLAFLVFCLFADEVDSQHLQPRKQPGGRRLSGKGGSSGKGGDDSGKGSSKSSSKSSSEKEGGAGGGGDIVPALLFVKYMKGKTESQPKSAPPVEAVIPSRKRLPPEPAPVDITLSPTKASPPPLPTKMPASAPATQPSVAVPTRQPVAVTLPDFFMSYVVPELGQVTSDDFETLRTDSESFFEAYLASVYADTPDTNFLGLDFAIDEALLNASIPADRFNVYVDWLAVAFFDTSSDVVPAGKRVLDDMISIGFQSYILDIVRQIPAFDSCNEVRFVQK